MSDTSRSPGPVPDGPDAVPAEPTTAPSTAEGPSPPGPVPAGTAPAGRSGETRSQAPFPETTAGAAQAPGTPEGEEPVPGDEGGGAGPATAGAVEPSGPAAAGDHGPGTDQGPDSGDAGTVAPPGEAGGEAGLPAAEAGRVGGEAGPAGSEAGRAADEAADEAAVDAGDEAAVEAGDEAAVEWGRAGDEAAVQAGGEWGRAGDEAAVEGAPPVEAGAAAGGAGVPGDGPAAVPADQIEWQPVASGDAITWQPVVTSAGAGTGFEWQDPDVAAGEAGPSEGNGATTAAANGAAGAGYDPAARPPRPPAGPRSVAARRRAQATTRPAAPAPAGAPSGDAEPPPDKTRRQVIVLSVLTVTIVAVAVLAFVLSRPALDRGEQAGGNVAPPTSVRTPPTLAESEFQGYRDDDAGFSLRYPKTWLRYVPPASDIRLAVAINPPSTDGFWVRVLPIQTEATQENIQNFKAVTDAVVFGDQRNKLIQEQLVLVNNRLAYYYLYTFEDDITRNQGIHAHYFIFDGLRMFSLVFQSVPTDNFTRQAGIFDQIAESFVAETPRVTTTTPPTTAG